MKLSRLGNAALWYAQKLGWLVFPLAPKGKIPAIAGGKGCLDATDDADVIVDWWSRIPDANIGLLAGSRSGVWILDIDPRNGGEESFDSAVANFGAFPQTIESLTGGGGRHLFFFNGPSDFYGIKWVPLAPGLDTKGGDKGYVVLPPSIHPSGKPYEWEASSRPLDVPIAPTPDWLGRLLRLNIAKKTHHGGPSLTATCEPRTFPLGKLFSEYGWLGDEFKPGTWAVRCPGEVLHSSGERFDTSTVLFGPGAGQRLGWFHCSHEHCKGLYARTDILENSVKRIAQSEGL